VLIIDQALIAVKLAPTVTLRWGKGTPWIRGIKVPRQRGAVKHFTATGAFEPSIHTDEFILWQRVVDEKRGYRTLTGGGGPRRSNRRRELSMSYAAAPVCPAATTGAGGRSAVGDRTHSRGTVCRSRSESAAAPDRGAAGAPPVATVLQGPDHPAAPDGRTDPTGQAGNLGETRRQSPTST
jgi:hypothetical protein